MKKLLLRTTGKVHIAHTDSEHWTLCGIYIYRSPGVAVAIPVTCKNCKRVVKIYK